VEGGRSLFLDGAAVAEALREEDPAAFELLATHAIPFFYRHDGWDYRAHQKVIELDARGNVSGVTISQHLQEDMDLPQAVLDVYYPAFCKFIRMMQEDRFLCRFRLNAGECIVFDNHRIVHGREGFSADSGQRHLRGCYTDRGAAWSTYRTRAERAAA
jgi:gamma-butyrobetaine dioxygenase